MSNPDPGGNSMSEPMVQVRNVTKVYERKLPPESDAAGILPLEMWEVAGRKD